MTFNVGRGGDKFWKSENGRTELNIVMEFCMHIYIDNM